MAAPQGRISAEKSSSRGTFKVEAAEVETVLRFMNEINKGPGQVEPEKIRILFLAADPADQSRLRLGEEIREIQEKLQLAKLRDQFTLEQRHAVRPSDITQALLDINPHIVHFSGHGSSDGALCFENAVGESHPVSPEALEMLFEQFAKGQEVRVEEEYKKGNIEFWGPVSCVVLNACYSKVQAEAIFKHVRCVVGMDKAVSDKAAIAFSIGFYQALGANLSVEKAYKLGCTQIALQGIPETSTPVLLSKKQNGGQ